MFPRNTSECDFMCFPSVLVAKKQHRLVLTCTQCPALSLPSCSGAPPALGNKLAVPTTPLPCVLRNVPVAALDHLRGGESILPLPQPASSSHAEFTLRNLVQTTQDVDPCSEKSPAMTEQCTTQQNRTMAKWAASSLSVRPSPKAIDLARRRKPWTQYEGDRG